MGNSNSHSSSGHHNKAHQQQAPHHHNHHPRYPHNYPPQDYDYNGWSNGGSHSLETPEQRNRMKRGYFPPRAYIGPASNPPPQKVLPQVVNPNKLLKATSNGAILHGGGTISGRKLSEIELEIRKRSTASCPQGGIPEEGHFVGGLSSGRSTPNLLAPRMGLAAGVVASSSSSRSRDYGSEPDLRDVGTPSSKTRVQVFPNAEPDFDLIEERSSSSPLPNSFTLISESPAKKQIRSRKKSKAPPPPMIHYPHEMMTNFIPYQYQLSQNPQRQLLLTPVTPQEKKSRLFKTKAEAKSSSALNSPSLRSPSVSNNSELMDLKNRSKNSAPPPSSHPIDRDRERKPKAEAPLCSPKPNIKQSKPNNIPSSQPQASVPKNEEKFIKKNNNPNKKTFYFGMDMGTFKQKNANSQQQPVADIHKEISRRKMQQKLEKELPTENKTIVENKVSSRSSSRNSGNNNSPGKKINEMIHNKQFLQKSNSNNRMSESDSDGIHRRQDSGSFDINEKKNNKQIGKSQGVIRESSSDLSSSDLDVPLVVTRPTLPQKKPDLPRFSPTAAWRAIDSPSRGSNNSGRSFDIDSSEEGRLHRFTRPSAPPRISNERSGDSGISAGDANSPANPIPLDETEGLTKLRHSYDSSSPNPRNFNKKGNNNASSGSAAVFPKRSDPMSADRMMKCWTPEQDLDESSSDFDHDNDPILPPAPPNPPKPSSTSSKCNLFAGKRASAVVSDSDSKYYGGSTSKSSDELNSRRYHGRGGKSWENPSKKRFNNNTPKSHNNQLPPRKSSSNIMHSNGFVGLDTNWFLSRSEPNSLNYVGLVHSPDFRKPAPAPPKKPKKKQPQQMLQGKTRATSNNNNNLSNDEFECELELGDEEEDSSDTFLNKQNNKKERKSNSGNKKKRSEIGYGPSSMNFNNNSKSSSSYEDQEEEIQVEEEEEEEELMRDDLFDYLDQYEEGEFEREQELTGDKKNDEVDNRPFSHHIMYLPSYDTRKVFGSSSGEGWRRTRSVDHLDSGEPSTLFRRENNDTKEKILHIQVEPRENIKVNRKSSVPSYFEAPLVNKKNGNNISKNSNSTIITLNSEDTKLYSPEEEERRLQNKKKFKFQSTLRVQERRKIEQELSREANHAEEERLREIEEMKRVEEEFQRKRRDKEEAEAKLLFSHKKQTSGPPPVVVSNAKKYVAPKKFENRMMSQRQEPEGAPASSSLCNSSNASVTSDLRRDLISASKKRSGNVGMGGQTQELSEYRQETRQYCDYRSRQPRQQSLSPARFIQKSSSDIFPVPSSRNQRRGGSSYTSGSKMSSSGRSTVHPEVICDIPSKPNQYMVNASRLSGSNSTMNMLHESERPNSVVGSSHSHFPPSSGSSDNYRKDWAHHLAPTSSRGSNNGGGLHGGRASSVISLHSAPAFSPLDNFRNSTSDLSRGLSPRFMGERHTPSNANHLLSRQYSASPPSSASPVPSSTPTDSFHHLSDKSSSRCSPVRLMGKTNTTVISIGPQIARLPPPSSSSKSNPGNFQAQPYNNSRAKGYRPVAFKPPANSTAVN